MLLLTCKLQIVYENIKVLIWKVLQHEISFYYKTEALSFEQGISELLLIIYKLSFIAKLAQLVEHETLKLSFIL